MKNEEYINIYQKIKSLAKEVYNNNGSLTRADLAYELKNLGIEKDSFYINELVWKAYNYFGKDEIIRTAFLDNESKQYLIDQYWVYGIINNKGYKELTSYLNRNLSEGNHSLIALESSIDNCKKNEIEKYSGSVISTVVGTKGVQDVQKEASALFDKYSKMINAYDIAKTDTKAIINDFVGVRGYIHEIYNKYSLVLTDIFGDSIKAVAPELFDYDSIEWLNTEDMMQNIQLEYDQVIDKCGELMGEISESFQNGLKMAASNYKMAGNKTVGLMMASLNMVNHYLYGSQQTAELKAQLLGLKNSVKHDVTNIKADLGRMMVIYKTMNDLYIPRANAFYKFSQQVLDKELEQLLDTIYSNPEIAEIKQERDHLLERYRQLERQIIDSQNNICYYTSHLNECKSLTNSMKPQYQTAKSQKPKKPFFCIGVIKSRYSRDLAEWYEMCEPVIRRYEDFQVDMHLDSEELEKHKIILKESIDNYNRMSQMLNDSREKMMAAINISSDTKAKMLEHLEPLIRLLHVGKGIMESKLNESLTKSVKIDCMNDSLPAEIKQDVQNFIATAKQNLYVNEIGAKKSLEYLNIMLSGDSNGTDNYSKEELLMVGDAQKRTIENAISLFESFGKLKAEEQRSRISHKAYDSELNKLRQQFQQSFNDIDNKSVILRETLKKLNTSQSFDELKEALMELSESDIADFTENDWKDFLNGNKTIKI